MIHHLRFLGNTQAIVSETQIGYSGEAMTITSEPTPHAVGFERDERIQRQHHSMADGRELIYFDDADSTLPPVRKPDARILPPRPETAQMRQDPLTGEWVSIAAARQNRAHLPPAHLDPLAPSSAANPSEIPDNYNVVVFENRSPSFGPATVSPGEWSLAPLREVGLERQLPSVGRCEVVCFGPESTGSFAELSVTRTRTVIEAWAERTFELSLLGGVEQVFPFENRGEAIGVTLHHPHGQIYSYPYITPRSERVLESIRTYGPTLFADILEREQNSERVLVRGEHFTAFVPFAARWPIEIHLLPHRQVPDLAALSLSERDELAGLYLRILRGVDALYDTPTPYIAAWHQAPVNSHRDDVRLMLQITSPRRAAEKLKFLAGSEAAMGAWIGDIAPEASASFIREAIARADKENPI